LGYGLFTSTDGEDLGDFTVVVDFTNQTVNDTGNEHSFGSFVEYHQEVREYHNQPEVDDLIKSAEESNV
jgi:hypothetical protein